MADVKITLNWKEILDESNNIPLKEYIDDLVEKLVKERWEKKYESVT